MTPSFIHLRLHSAYSLLEGAIPTGVIAELCVADNMPAVAVTDSGNLFGGMDFSKSFAEVGVQPILGTELDIWDNEYKGKIVLLVKNEIGYQNLLKIFNLYYMAEGKDIPHITFDEIQGKSEGLICLSGGVSGLIGQYVLKGKDAEPICRKFLDFFPNNFYMEIQRHQLEDEDLCEPVFLELAYRLNIPLVATNEAYFSSPDYYESQDALICIADKTLVDIPDRRHLTEEHYFKTQKEMCELFSDLPEAVQNTVQIARRCGFMLSKRKAAFPKYDCGLWTEDELLRQNAENGLKEKLKNIDESEHQKYWDRLKHELDIICQMRFPGYFLIVADFINWSKNHGVPVGPGRGSGAGSLVAWCLKITDLDPLKLNLLFERFLNPERVSMPDFDVDFCQEKRELAINYVQEKYGFDHVAQIITFGKLQAKAVIRDVGRVLGIPYPVVDRISKLVPNGLNPKGKPWKLKEVFEVEPEFRQMMQTDPQIKQLLDIAVQLEGLNRNTSTHAAGVVIGREPLENILPIYKDPSSDMPVTQFDMHWVEDSSLIKFDFLGLKTLTVIAKTLELIKGEKPDIANIPLDDKKVFELLTSGDTAGVFQLESDGMRKAIKDLQPDKFEDLIALVSLYRPGPMENIPHYINRKHGLEEPDYLHPLLEPVLKETYGIMIYQEQVMQIAQVLAGYTLGAADLLRRAMGKKKHEEMKRQRVIFIEGASKNGVGEEKATEIFDLMEKFANYGFNKSHAAAYSLIAYQTAWLKVHYPAEFMAATMTLDKGDTDKLCFFKQAVLGMGIEILPPDINLSDVNFKTENGAIRYALSALKNVGEGAMELLQTERNENGAFKDISDFVCRVDDTVMNKRCLESLIKSGAMDCFGINRGKLFHNIPKMISFHNSHRDQISSNQISLFASDSKFNDLILDNAPLWSKKQELDMELSAIGYYLSSHPMDMYSANFDILRVIGSKDLDDRVPPTETVLIKMAGIVSEVRERISEKTGKKFAFVTIGDSFGSTSFICFSNIYDANKEILQSGKPLLFYLNANRREGQVQLSLQSILDLDEVLSTIHKKIEITLDNNTCIPMIKEILSNCNGGDNQVNLILETGGYVVEMTLGNNFNISAEALMKLRSLSGIKQLKQG